MKKYKSSLVYEWILAFILSFFFYILITTSLYRNLRIIDANIVDDSMEFTINGTCKGTGMNCGSNYNTPISMHNDRIFLLAKT